MKTETTHSITSDTTRGNNSFKNRYVVCVSSNGDSCVAERQGDGFKTQKEAREWINAGKITSGIETVEIYDTKEDRSIVILDLSK